MFRKRIVILTVFLLSCCSLICSCTASVTKETEQSSEKRSNKKKTKDKNKVNEESTEESTEEIDLSNNSPKDNSSGTNIDETTREELKAQLVSSLDSFFAAEVTCSASVSTGNGTDSIITANRIKYNDDIIYSVITEFPKTKDVILNIGTKEESYFNTGGGTTWGVAEDQVTLRSPIVNSGIYPIYISYVYSLLNEGLDCKYVPDDDLYIIERAEGSFSEINFHAIDSALADPQAMEIFYESITDYYMNLITYAFGTKIKSYEFSIKGDVFSVTERLCDQQGNEIEHSTTTRMKAKEGTVEEFKNITDAFDQLHGMSKSQ